MKTFDAIIIGSGQGGTPLAKKLAKAGWNTALIEKNLIGGTCVNVGCTPTKTMIASAKTAFTVANAATYGVITNQPSIDMAAVLNRKNAVVEQFRDGAQEGLEKTENLSLIWGEASFTDQKTIQVKLNDGGKETVTSSRIFIDAGCRPNIPDVEGLKESGYLTSSSILDLKEIPEHLLIIGAGYIALEFGQMYKRFGSKVTILEPGKDFLHKEDKDVADIVKAFLEEENIEIITEAKVIKVAKQKDIQVTIQTPGEVKEVACSHILVAAGRSPNIEALNLPAAGVQTDEKGHIKTNDYLETTTPGIYALGDIKGGPEFTHISYNDHVVLLGNLLHQKNNTIAGRMVPYCMFTDPHLARVGITEHEARSKGLNIKVATLSMKQVARAIETGTTHGIMKAIVDAETNQILGAAVVGAEGGEIMSVLQMAMVGKIDYKQMSQMIFAHPLYSESLNNLFLSLDK